jgi:hypothetical protein
MDIAQLPYIDEHTRDLAGEPADVWPALLDAIDHAWSNPVATLAARALGCDEHAATGPRPLAPGSTVPGFRVTRLVTGAELVLAGRHRFSSYAVISRVEAAGHHRTRLHVESRASFPGPAGRAYRVLVIGSGGHVVAVRRLLSRIARRVAARVPVTA